MQDCRLLGCSQPALTGAAQPFPWPLQLAAGELARLLPQLQPESAAAMLARCWAATALAQLQLLVPQLAEGQGSAVGGGAGSLVLPHHHQLFAELVHRWLALWAASHLPEGCLEAAGPEAWAAAVAEAAAGPAGAGAAASAPQVAAVAAAAEAAWRERARGLEQQDCAPPLLLF